MKAVVALTSVTALLAPAMVAAQMPAPPTPVFLKKAGASDLFERQEGQIMSASRNPAVRRFAMKMVHDHTQSTTMVKAAARRAGMHPGAPMLTRDQRHDLAALRAARGPARDQLYVQQQKMAHQDALALMQAYADGGSARPLRDAAGKIVPVVKMHIDMLSRM
jgi:putative membrane protein